MRNEVSLRDLTGCVLPTVQNALILRDYAAGTRAQMATQR